MTYILALISVPLFSATGIYNPPVMRHGQCIAEPGTYEALYCQPQTAPQSRHRYRHSRR
jgi:hypothetical protein